MRRALALIEQAFADHRPALMFSGGWTPASCLTWYTRRQPTGLPRSMFTTRFKTRRPWISSPSEQRITGAKLTVARPDRTAFEQWQAQGWPILGPKPSREWMNKYRHLGIRINCEACCGRMKIKPGRDATKAIGCDAQLTGIPSHRRRQPGTVLHEHGNCYLTNGLMIYHPLSHWTDLMVRRYRRQHDIPQDPTSAPGDVEWMQVLCRGLEVHGQRDRAPTPPGSSPLARVHHRAGRVASAPRGQVPPTRADHRSGCGEARWHRSHCREIRTHL